VTKSSQRPARKSRRSFGLSTELRNLGLCLGLGVVVLPCLIWLVGRTALGPYTNGGLFSLWTDFIRGLARGSTPFWVIALGPYGFLCLLRGGWYLLTR
jgi:hypothetical protein